MPEIITSALDATSRQWFAIGLGAAFLITVLLIVVFMRWSEIDHGFLGLILLLTLIFFLIAFSFLVAASVAGFDIKIAVAVVDALVVFGSKLLAPRFLEYLESGCDIDDNASAKSRRKGAKPKSDPLTPRRPSPF